MAYNTNAMRTATGSDAYTLCVTLDKALTKKVLAGYGVPSPRGRLVTRDGMKSGGLDDFAFPVIVKPNIEGSGAGMQRFDTLEALRRAAADGILSLGVDHTALVQEFLEPRGGHIVRVEILDGRFLYAIKVFPKPEEGFNLCPADICHPADAGRTAADGAERPGEARTAGGPMFAADLCPVEPGPGGGYIHS